MIEKRTGTLKPLLLNQQFIAGIGNYLADEILFRCNLHPLRTANTLNKKEIKESKGSASKAVASTKSEKQEVIAEGHEMRDRFKKLAGIL